MSTLEEIKAAWPAADCSTHYEGCEKRHYVCAIHKLIEMLEGTKAQYVEAVSKEKEINIMLAKRQRLEGGDDERYRDSLSAAGVRAYIEDVLRAL